MDEKKGINIFQRLMNVVFIAWASWFLINPILAVFVGESDVYFSTSNVNKFPLIYSLTFLGWLPILAVNYIFNKKATVWNKAESD